MATHSVTFQMAGKKFCVFSINAFIYSLINLSRDINTLVKKKVVDECRRSILVEETNMTINSTVDFLSFIQLSR